MINKGSETRVQPVPDADEEFLQRWSRRKQQHAAGQPLPPESVVEPTTLAEQAPVADAPVLTDADMTPIEELTEDSDYSAFMSSGVSDQLRNLALRKLFHVPVFNIRDGLDDYDGDFTTFAKLGDIITCDMKHMLEVEARKNAEKLLAEQEAADQPPAELAADEMTLVEEEPVHVEQDWSDEIEDVESAEL